MTQQDDVVLVFCNPTTKEFHSKHANFLVMIEEGKIVAYDEFNEILSYGTDMYLCSAEHFNSFVQYIQYTEMTYSEYQRNHQNKLAKDYPDAPVLAEIQDNTRPVNPILKNLSDKGIKVKLF